MAGMGDINALLGGQELVDETTLPDADGAQLEDTDGGPESTTGIVATDEPGEVPLAKRVPLGALQEERTRRQELQDQLRQQTELNQRMQERFNQLMERMAAPQQPQQPAKPAIEIPAFIDDPEGHLAALQQKFEAEIAELRQHQQGNAHQQQAAEQGQRLAAHVAQAESEFMATTADYPAAAQFFMERKAAEYAALGADPVTIQTQIQRDYQGIAIAATQRGANPAEVLYKISKAMGYAPGAQPQGQSRQPAKPAPTSLSNVNGTARSPEEASGVSLESVANMSDAEFDKFWRQMERGSRQAPKI